MIHKNDRVNTFVFGSVLENEYNSKTSLFPIFRSGVYFYEFSPPLDIGEINNFDALGE